MFREEITASILMGLMGLVLAIFALCLWIAKEIFEHVIWMVFRQDIPWYLDVLGAIVFNGFNFAIWVICLVMTGLGFEPPLADYFVQGG